MRELFILVAHLLATLAKLIRPGGVRSVIAESLLLKHQLLTLKRSRKRTTIRYFAFTVGLPTCACSRSMRSSPFRTPPFRIASWNG